ncbi:FAD-linked oxidase [Pigmentiphaga litoralis]|uniref:FAD-binding oxidoreductase n=1 Tax=Pigmentiphaga litoralis TaxID=516702 RepID=UPI0016752910|nr:FAD-binding oxidoreductase [Pigmentiphaga litoralis]GGX34958.1 FAD-linked oxidase [Pigmentiphaga litoralis]
MKEQLIEDLRALLGDEAVLTGDAVTGRSAGAFRPDALTAYALVRPKTTVEVAEVMKRCAAVGQAVVTHGGLTGLVRGADASPDELILSMERMTRIEGIDVAGRTMTVEAGVTLQQIQEAAAAVDLYYGVDYGARGTATIGGGIATNAGGNRVIRFGMTRASVLGLEAVLADGRVISSMNTMMKNNSGYDLKQLFIGSEGTLGVVTRAVIRLHEMPASQCTALVAATDFDAVVRLLKHMDRKLGGQLAAFELMWQAYFDLVSTPPAQGRSPFAERYPFYVLLESLGADQEADSVRFMQALEDAMADGLIVDATVAQSLDQRDALWRMRDSVEEMFKFGKSFNYDVSLPVSEMRAYADGVSAAAQANWPQGRCWIFGHMGDGNLHVSFSVGDGSDATKHRIDEIVYGPLAAFRGAVSAEHGIGLDKRAWLGVSRTDEELALMRQLKDFLDPQGLLNPGKVV